ncbi:hypothetical protein HG537_0H03190 [Torulaspora globosa]|uniref:Uncharacterized protein n=1 Tax=Torulaspora globosa TaxID=48254 RepID=A0A7H9I141_9SACH|nr:hypothetical protein HG537_0H03190 [Torulaspora sp. CBS 2947]
MTSGMETRASQRKYNNVTLRTLTAYQLMSQRESMCELFQLVDDTERHNSIVDIERQKRILEDMKKQVERLKDSC